LEQYWSRVKPENLRLEHEMDSLDPQKIKTMTTEDFYEFLYHKYFVWKYTAKNRLATTRKQLIRYRTEPEAWEHLGLIHKQLFTLNPEDIESGLTLTHSIHGLGVAGASGLLSLLYPAYFGTVDQFVVAGLHQVPDLVSHLPPNKKDRSLTIQDGITLIKIFRQQAADLNRRFHTTSWTPRKIDMILWTLRDDDTP